MMAQPAPHTRFLTLPAAIHGNLAMPTNPVEFGEPPRVVLVTVVDSD
jgi:hypothetical protein